MPLAPGTRLGPYEILAPIGAGGMGEVWTARDTRLDRIVAIKRLKVSHSARFEQEARAIATLNHPHICQIYDIGPDYLVMEYVEGKPLRGPLRAEEAVKLGLQIADALVEAHGSGILHRDLKPGNILVTRKGATKLLDFGLAKLMTASDSDVTKTVEGAVMGTAAYMAPEQAEGKQLDARSDIFSFGAVLYELLAGRRAFSGDSMAAVLSAVRSDDPAPLQAPVALGRVVMRCLSKKPAQRFQTMAEVRAALEQVSTKPAEQQPSIAVLPFANLSADKENEYFSDGLAEEIINLLAHISGLKVIARTSAFAFRGKEQDITEIAEALRVTTILEGSVRKAGNRIRVNAQLISAEDGSHLWSERYDREMADVFGIQDEIAAAIAAALKMKLSLQPAEPRQYTPHLAAYEALLRARHHYNKLTPQSMARAQEYFEQAIALDPGYALPHCEIGASFTTLATYSMLPAHQAMRRARAAVQKALDIDPSLQDALATLGWIAELYDYDWNEAERLFRLATARNPVPPRVRHRYASHLLLVGRLSQAIEEIERCLNEDPLNPYFRMLLEFCFLVAGRPADAAKECHRILELDENYHLAYLHLSFSHAQQGELEEAVTTADMAHSLAPWNLTIIGYFAGLLIRTGDVSRAVTMLQKLGDGKAYGAPLGFVYYYLACSEIDLAADWAEKAIEQRAQAIPAILQLPLAKDLRSSSRWPALAKMMNLPDAV